LAAHYQQGGRTAEMQEQLRISMALAEKNSSMKLQPYWPTLEAMNARWGQRD